MPDWRILREEELGMVQDKVWVTNGTETALFKPDTDRNADRAELLKLVEEGKIDAENAELLIGNPYEGPVESEIEYEFYRIASALNIPCAKIEIIDLFGRHGILSYNVKTDESVTYCPAGRLYKKSKGITHESKDSKGDNLSTIGELLSVS